MTEATRTKLTIEQIVSTKNVATFLTQPELDELGMKAVEGYNADRGSRLAWEQRNEKAIKLALQVQETKTFPWQDCSNVKFPLLTVAALQFLARVSIMTKGRKLAKVESIGRDPDGMKFHRASRISTHLSLQLLEEDPNWLNNDEQAKLSAAILGSAFKKTYVEALTGTVISEHIPAMNIVLDYFCKDITKATRITHVLSMSENSVQSKVRQGLFLDVDLDEVESPETNLLRQAADEAEGLQRPTIGDCEREVLEQQCWLDLDGDGYKEPYVMFVHRESAKVLRIVARFFDVGDVHRINDPQVRAIEYELAELGSRADLDTPLKMAKAQSELEKKAEKLQNAKDNLILSIEPVQYYTRYLFIPSPDGGVYGLGLGALIGPLNESVNTLVNQLIDSGTMSNTAGGFLGRGVKIKAGNQSFSPFEWKPVDSPGADLRANIVPLPVREPSLVLYQLLGMLVAYGEKIGSSTDIMTGESPGQNTPAETSRNTVEQGMMLFSGIYARIYRGFKEELTKFYTFNRLYLEHSPRYYDLVKGPDAILAADDYSSSSFRIFPAASPEAVSASQIKAKAAALDGIASSHPGFNQYLVTKQLLEALEIEDIDAIYPDPAGPNAIKTGPDPKVAQAQAELAHKVKVHEDEMALAVAELRNEIRLTDAKIVGLQADARQSIAQANGVATGHEIALINAKIGAARDHQRGLVAALGHLTKVASMDGGAKAAKDAALLEMKPPSEAPLGQEQVQSTQPQGAIVDGDNAAGQDGLGASPSDGGIPSAIGGQ